MSRGHNDQSSRSVAIFIPTLAIGGAEKIAVILANTFADRGHDVSLLVGIADGPIRAEVGPRVSIVDLGQRRVSRCIIPLSRWLRQRRPAVLLSLMKHANIAAIAASHVSRSPHRLVVSERTFTSVSVASERPLRRLLLGVGIRWGYRYADAVVTVCADAASDLEETYGLSRSRLHVIHNPVDVEVIRRRAEGEPGKWWPTDSRPTVLSVARLAPPKDYATLVDAFASLRRETDARLVIIGDGILRPVVEERVRSLGLEGSVVMPGYAANPYSAMKRADCFVLSSRWEGFPNVLVEAAALGVPIVATDCRGGPREILEGIEGAHLVPVGDIQAMSAAIQRAIRTIRPVMTLMRRAEEFSVVKAVSEFEGVLGLSS